MRFFILCHLVILALVTAMDAVRENSYLLLGCKSDAELSNFISRFVIREKQRFRVVHLDSGISVAEVDENSVLQPQPFKVLSTHRITEGKAEALKALLYHLNFGPISGVFCELECEDERHEQLKSLHMTGVVTRSSKRLFARFKKQGNTNYLHVGEAFTFWNHPVREKDSHRMIQSIFSYLPAVRLMDTFWVYCRAEAEGRCALGSSRGSGSDDSESCLSHAMAAELFPWDLFFLGLGTKDAPLLHYLMDEMPEYHHQILTTYFTELPNILAVDEIGTYQWRYGRLYSCMLSQPYHKSFGNIVSVNQRRYTLLNRLEDEESTAAYKLKPLKEKEANALLELDAASESNAHDAPVLCHQLCKKLDGLAKEILQVQKDLMMITAFIHEQLEALKEEEESYYFLD